MRLHRLSERLEWHLFPPVFSEAQALDQRHEVDLSPACATLGSGWLTRAASLSPQGAVSHAFTTRTLAMFSPPPRQRHTTAWKPCPVVAHQIVTLPCSRVAIEATPGIPLFVAIQSLPFLP